MWYRRDICGYFSSCIGKKVSFETLNILNLIYFEQESSDEMEKFIADQATFCQKDTNASDKDVKELLDGAEPTTKVAKCLNACLMNKLGIVSVSPFTKKELL